MDNITLIKWSMIVLLLSIAGKHCDAPSFLDLAHPKATAFGAADLGMYSLRTIIPNEQDAGALGYENQPSIVYSSFCGEVAVLLSVTLNVSCVALTAIKTW